MASQTQKFVIGSGRTFTSTKRIATKQHMRVWLDDTVLGKTVLLDTAEYDLINNSAVISSRFDMSSYFELRLMVADTPEELGENPTDTETVAGIADEVVVVAGIEEEVKTVSGMHDEVITVAGMEQNIQDILTPPLTQAILDAEANAAEATAGATKAELEAWEAEAEKMTADSYATEAEDVFVKDWASDGDGTFTSTNTTDYSSYHWQEKAKGQTNPLNFIAFWDASGGVYPPVTPTPADGDFYIVDVRGIIETITYEVRDWIVWESGAWNKLDNNTAGGVEAGMVMHFAATLVPNGWLVCDASEVSQAVYPDLYATIGDVWNTTGGAIAPSAGNFRLPPSELSGRGLYLQAGVSGVHVPQNVSDHDHDSTFAGDVLAGHEHVTKFDGNYEHADGDNVGLAQSADMQEFFMYSEPVSAGTPSGTVNTTALTGDNTPESIEMVMCIKAFGVIYNPDEVNIGELEAQVIANELEIGTLDAQVIALEAISIPVASDVGWDGTVLADIQALRDFYGDQAITEGVGATGFTAKSYPDGSVVGSNSLGSFEFMANGKLSVHCTGSDFITTTSKGNVFYNNGSELFYPIVFTSIQTAIPIASESGSSATAISPYGYNGSLSGIIVGAFGAVATDAFINNVHTIGSWKA